MNRRYLDYASTTPTDPEAVKAMQPYFFEKFGNALSPHSFGREAQKALEDAREKIAKFIGAQAQEIIFTSGAGESNNHAILGTAQRLKNKGNHIITTKIEHHTVLEPLRYLEKEGFKVTYLNADKDGLVDPQDVQKAITDKTILIAVMHANNEIGVLEPVAPIGDIAQKHNIYFLVDAAQNELKANFVSFSAHKFYGPKGIGVLYVKKGTHIPNLILGGGQERGLRGSTHNVAGAVGLGKAIELCEKNMPSEAIFQSSLRDRLTDGILKNIPGARSNGHSTNRLPNIASFSFEGVEGESLLTSLDMIGIAASMGSACTSGAMEPSHVLRAIGLSDELAYGSLRISIGRWTKEEDIDHLLAELPKIVKRLREA